MRIEAIIFDMDGTIIDSGPLWKKAEKEVFAKVGVKVSDELCKITESMPTTEVVKFWYGQQPWGNKAFKDVENEVIDYVEHLVKEEGIAINGIEETLKKIKYCDYKIGLATNSPYRLIPVVLKKFDIEDYFDIIASAEHELQGKPNPAIYLSVAKKLNVKPEACIVFEDSYLGLSAAKDAGMKTIAVINDNFEENVKSGISDIQIKDYMQFDFSLISEI